MTIHTAPGELWVLVTASRTWPHEPMLRSRLRDCYDYAIDTHQRLTVMHGGAPGGDSMAHQWARHAHHSGWAVNVPEVRRADWRGPCRKECSPGHRRVQANGTTCPVAGYYRNEAMVDEMVQKRALGHQVLMLAFIDGESKGATHCYKYGKQQGLDPVLIESGRI